MSAAGTRMSAAGTSMTSGALQAAAIEAEALQAEALNALLAAADPALVAFIARERERAAALVGRDDAMGTQARLWPVKEAFILCFSHEMDRGFARGGDMAACADGIIATIADLADQLALNISLQTDGAVTRDAALRWVNDEFARAIATPRKACCERVMIDMQSAA